ncbi:MAG: hypothetical protein ACRD0I_12155, partial [Acidimicrobiales bacterium]
VRRSLLASDLHFDPSFKSVEDWDLWLRCLRRTAAGVVPEPLVRYVVHREPRLTDTDTQRRGLDAFVAKYATEMSGPCRAFHQAHLRMESGMGWAKKAKVVGALMAPSPATPILIGEQVARQLSRLRRDPGLTERALARLIPT